MRKVIKASKSRMLSNIIDRAKWEIRDGRSVDEAIDKVSEEFGLAKDGKICKHVKSVLEDTYIDKKKKVGASRKVVKPQNIQADFRADHAAARERAKAKKAALGSVEEVRNADDPMQKAFDLWVPAQGKADNKAGELIRAMMKIMYRDFNDGDVFYEGYGIETCAGAVAFLIDKIPELENDFEDIAMAQLDGDAYTSSIEKISQKVLDYIYENPNLIREASDEDFLDWDGEGFIEDMEWEPRYEYDCSIPDNVQFHLDKGDISERDVEWEIQEWDNFRDAAIKVEWGQIYIENLTRDEYDEIEGHMYRWLEEWGNDLDDEYGSEDDEYEEDEEYEED